MLEDKNPQRTSLEELGEFGLLDHLTQHFELKQPSSLTGIGDDAAVMDFKDKKVIVSTDMLVEGVHFDLLFTIDQVDFPKIKGNPNLTVIGHMTEKREGVHLITRAETKIPITAQGWNSFNETK